ncbi:hypothetical protein NECAME_07946 [Necator americanus]|uniref:Uncharacterized protein n=1 Tax=Necator americanus TaxID=51031 RepID=W2TK95_NECAM|nr:hypothetical protein NECAME_07946 [Necator americanus]ETN82500.1 hypothetical protein NECAME_07946 [Necator americanus]
MSFDAANAKYEAKFSEKAVNCPNVLSDSVCSKLYDVREAKLDDANDRDDKCYKTHPSRRLRSAIVLKDAAIAVSRLSTIVRIASLRELGEKRILQQYLLHPRAEETVLWQILRALLNDD